MKLELSDFDVKSMCERAIADELRHQFNNGYSGLKKQFDAGLADTLQELAPVINDAVKHGIRAALSSPEFAKRMQDELLKACSDKFGGAMAAIMKSAAKRAADEPELRENIQRVVLSAACGVTK